MGKKYCQVCSKKCKSFAIRIDENVYVHSDCFRCFECKGELELSKFYFKNKHLFCIKDFKKLYYPKCVKCALVIEDEMVKVMGQQYHVNCLCCSFCKATSKHGDKLNFDGKNLICRQCTLISLRVQNLNKMSSEASSKTQDSSSVDSAQKNVAEVQNSVACNSQPPKTGTEKRDSEVVNNSKPVSLASKPPLFPSLKSQLKSQGERISSPLSWDSSSGPSSDPRVRISSPCYDETSHRTSTISYLNRPSNFRRGPSFNVSHTATNIQHFHLPEQVEGMQKFSRLRSRTLPKTAVYKPWSREGSLASPTEAKSPTPGTDGQSPKETKVVSPPPPQSPPARSMKKEERTTSRDTLTKTPLPGISEDGLSMASHASIHLPSKGYALKPGYGLKPIMYACYGTNPESKAGSHHIHSGAVSAEDSKDTKSISLGSDCYGSFHSAEEEERLDPYTGLKRNRSVRSTASYDPRMNRSRTLMEVVSSKRPITVSQFLKKVELNEGDRVKKYSYQDLKRALESPTARLMNRDRLEDHLLDDEFQKLFQVERTQFDQLPQWKRSDLKRRHNLY